LAQSGGSHKIFGFAYGRGTSGFVAFALIIIGHDFSFIEKVPVDPVQLPGFGRLLVLIPYIKSTPALVWGRNNVM
jgi:hypothetical protein